jgi:uncharacterized MAPEG superfamily protein
MTFAYWMLIAAAMMPYLTIALAKSAGGIDNRAPRPSLESLSGWRQRADWAHRNHFEAFPAFVAAVFVAELTHARQTRIDQLAGMVVLLRVVYTRDRNGDGQSRSPFTSPIDAEIARYDGIQRKM